MRQIELADQVYEKAKRCANDAGFESVEEFIEDMVVNVLSGETENIDNLFTPKVIGDLDQVAGSVKSGAKTYTQKEVDEHFRKKSATWRDTEAN